MSENYLVIDILFSNWYFTFYILFKIPILTFFLILHFFNEVCSSMTASFLLLYLLILEIMMTIENYLLYTYCDCIPPIISEVESTAI